MASITVRLGFAALLAAVPGPGVAQSAPPLAIVHVTLIDGTGAPPRRDVTVIVAGGRVRDIVPARSARLPRGARVVDGTGKYLIPGLCDAHVHLWHGERSLGRFVAHGVTCVRDMGGDLERIRRWRAAAGDDSLVAPRILAAAGPWLSAAPWADDAARSAVVRSADDARRAVDSIAGLGADFIKVMTDVPRAAYFAAAGRARERGLPVAGHLPIGVDLGEVLDSGQRTIEHLILFGAALSGRESELRARFVDAAARGDNAEVARINAEVLASFSEAKQKAVLARLAATGTAVTPTLVLHRAQAAAGDSDFTADPRLAALPDSGVGAWAARPPPARRTPEQVAAARAAYARQEALVAGMQRAGVRLLAGTDAGDRYRYAGGSLHDELSLLVRAGLTPAEALRAASANVARALGAADSLGTVEPGKLADLVLLDADPLAAIGNVRRVRAVVLGGRLLDSAALRRLTSPERGPPGPGRGVVD